MQLPQLNSISTSRDYTQEFMGYDHNLRIEEGEFYNTQNLTADYYPMLSPRNHRGYVRSMDTPLAMAGKDQLVSVEGSSLVYGTMTVDMGLDTTTEKQLINMGAYVLIFPDNKYFNTCPNSDGEYEWGSLGASYTSTGTVSYTLTNEDGDAYNVKTVGTTAPTSPGNGDYWLDTSQSPHSLKVYSSSSSQWVSVGSTYVKITASGIDDDFEVYDGVDISGIGDGLSEVHPGLADLNSTMIIWAKGDDYIVVVGIIDNAVEQTEPITVERRIPTMEYFTESNNRIWGCHYGLQDGEIVNEIYACKLGDPKNWRCFMGISTDSYTVSLGSDGAFTGACTHLGYPIFWKEGCFHKIYGEQPSSYQMVTTNCRGVQAGSGKSLAIVGNTLYYKSETEVMSFDGSLPSSVSSALGDIHYSGAVAGSFKDKYYISMADDSGIYSLFTYDTKRGLWMREDATQAVDFARVKNELYFRDADDRLWSVNGTAPYEESHTEGDFEWSAETGEIGYSYPDKKYLSRYNIRMKLEKDSVVRTYVRYDGNSEWEFIGSMTGHTVKTFTLPVVPKRCDHLALKLTGRGDCKIYSIAKVLELGSDA